MPKYSRVYVHAGNDEPTFFARVDTENNWTVEPGQMSKDRAKIEELWLQSMAELGASEFSYHPDRDARWAGNLVLMLPGSKVLSTPNPPAPAKPGVCY